MIKIHLKRLDLPIVDGELTELLFADDYYVKWDAECLSVNEKRLVCRVYQPSLAYMASYDDGALDYVFRPETGMVIPNKPSTIEIEQWVKSDVDEVEIVLYHHAEELFDVFKLTNERIESAAHSELALHRTAFELPDQLNSPELELEIEVTGGQVSTYIRTFLFEPFEPVEERADR